MTTRQLSRSRTIDASPSTIFRVIADPTMHPVIDGSGTVHGTRAKPEQLRLGSRFLMRMTFVVPYVIHSTVVEFEQDRRIAWSHWGRHRWRYELAELDAVDGHPQTEVTETFDWSTAISPRVIELIGYPRLHEAGIDKTLERLDAFVTNRASAL